MDSLLRRRGDRYRTARLQTYQTTCDAQIAAVKRLRGFLGGLESNVADCRGLILYGPSGTGKDHLLVAAMGKALVGHGLNVEWRNGLALYAAVRDTFSTGGTEYGVLGDLINADVLAISDPLPPSGGLTEFQQGTLFRVLDERYSANRPTWMTINVADYAELEARLGVSTADRLRDGATVIHCNWPSYRKAAS